MAGIMIAAPKSGSGKTMITCGILALLKRKGYRPMACKCGPDYIDGLFHRTVLGVETQNLDSYFETADHMRQKAGRAMEDHFLVAEGVMGYFDGLGGVSLKGSCQEIRSILGLPALLVIDAKGASLSLLALIQGFLDFEREADGGRGIRGIFLNRTSKGVYQMIKPLVEERFHIPVVGYLPELDFLKVGNRHLGLILPEEIEGLRWQLEQLADRLEEGMDWDSFWQMAGRGPSQGRCFKSEPKGSFEAFPLAVARDGAFCFYYQDNRKALEEAGAVLTYFSPLADKALPPDCCGLLLGGGYPENFAKELGENRDMREAVKRAAREGMPVLAECGGYLYLLDSLEGTDGKCYPMAGVLEGHGYRAGKTGRFGYISIHADRENPYLISGEEIRGHEFHYWDCCLEDGRKQEAFCMEAVKPIGGRRWPCMRTYQRVLAGFPHLYYPSCPEFVRRFARQCLEYRKEQSQ